MNYSEIYFYHYCYDHMNTPRYITILTVKELADYLQVGSVIIYSWTDKRSQWYRKDFPVIKIGHTVRFVKEKVDEYLQIS